MGEQPWGLVRLGLAGLQPPAGECRALPAAPRASGRAGRRSLGRHSGIAGAGRGQDCRGSCGGSGDLLGAADCERFLRFGPW